MLTRTIQSIWKYYPMMKDIKLEHAKCGASRSGKTTCSNAGTLVPRKETKGLSINFRLLKKDKKV